MKSSYPPLIKNYLKIMPSVVIGFVIIGLIPTVISTLNYKNHERNPKPYYKSGPFEKMVRNREDRFRYYMAEHLKNQPGDKQPDSFVRQL